MYIETSSPRQQGDRAKLNSPMLQFSGSMCLKFYYHMYGADIATLNVTINGNKVFAASGNKGNKWLSAAIDISLSGTHAVREIIMSFERCLVYCYCHENMSVSIEHTISHNTGYFLYVFLEINTFISS